MKKIIVIVCLFSLVLLSCEWNDDKKDVTADKVTSDYIAGDWVCKVTSRSSAFFGVRNEPIYENEEPKYEDFKNVELSKEDKGTPETISLTFKVQENGDMVMETIRYKENGETNKKASDLGKFESEISAGMTRRDFKITALWDFTYISDDIFELRIKSERLMFDNNKNIIRGGSEGTNEIMRCLRIN